MCVADWQQSYDNWHTFGVLRPDSRRPSRDSRSSISKEREEDEAKDGFPVVARISRHIVRLEREYKLAERLKAEDDPECIHFAEPVQFLRLPARLPGEHTLVAFIVRAPGSNYLRHLVEFGPNFYRGSLPSSPTSPDRDVDKQLLDADSTRAQVPMHLFLDFAIGAAKCCEILHHGKELVHGGKRACIHNVLHLERLTSLPQNYAPTPFISTLKLAKSSLSISALAHDLSRMV